ncbi:MAG: HNH endonuclease signature motif containing protein [Myroides sp.]
MQEIIKPINGTNRYFISNLGYTFKVVGSKEFLIPLNINKGIPRVKIQDRRFNLPYLLLEHFSDSNINSDSIVTFKIIDNKVPLEFIKVRNIKYDNKDEEKIIKFKCDVKASSSNYRVSYTDLLTKYDVLNSLKRTEFKCFYCGDGIKTTSWHLDHVHPLSKGGKNIATNITPSCPRCNLMKTDMLVSEFIHMCTKISNNNNK